MKRKLSLFLAFSLLLSIFSTVFVLGTSAADDLNDHLLVNFDFEGTTPLKDTTGTYTFTKMGTTSSIADGVVTTLGDNTGYLFINQPMLKQLDNTLSIVLKVKAPLGSLFFRWFDSTGEFYRVKFETNGKLWTSLCAQNSTTSIAVNADTEYYIGISLIETDAGVTEKIYVVSATDGTLQNWTYEWTDSNINTTKYTNGIPSFSSIASSNVGLNIGRAGAMELDDFRMYNCSFDALSFGTLVEDMKAPATVADDLSDNVVGEFDFENPTAPLKDATGTNSLALAGAATVANGVVSTNAVSGGGNYLYRSNFQNMLSTVDSSFTTVIKFKLDSFSNFNFALSGTNSGSVYRFKFNASGVLETSIGDTWNYSFKSAVVETDTWYYMVISLDQTEAGITESVYLWPAAGGDVMGGSKLWTGTLPTLANMKSDINVFLAIGRYDPMHIEMLNFYNAYTNAHTVEALREYYALNDKPVTEITSEPKLGNLMAKFDFDALDAPLTDNFGKYTMTQNGTTSTVVDGVATTVGDGAGYFVLNNDTIFNSLTDSLTIVMKVKAPLNGQVFFRWADATGELYRVNFNTNGKIGTSLCAAWSLANFIVTADTEYYVAINLTETAAGVTETIYAMPTAGGALQTATKEWTDAGVGGKYTAIPDFSAIASSNIVLNLGRAGAVEMDELRFYNAALTEEELGKLFEMMGGHAPVDSQAPEFVGVQLGEGIDGFNIRFVSVINELDYATLGYKLVASWTEGGQTVTKEATVDCTYVYETLYGNDGANTVAYKAADYAGKYFTALTVTEVPEDLGAVTFTVTPYGTIEIGDELGYLVSTKTVYGVTYEITYNKGSLSYKTIGTTDTKDEAYVPTESAPDNANTAAPLFQPAAGNYYNYCPSVMELEDGSRYTYYCTNGTSGNITDYIAVRKGTPNGDGSYAWGAEKTVLAPTAGTWDSRHVCDPSVIAGEFSYNGTEYSYLMAYLGCDTDFNNNEIGLAVANSPEGPF